MVKQLPNVDWNGFRDLHPCLTGNWNGHVLHRRPFAEKTSGNRCGVCGLQWEYSREDGYHDVVYMLGSRGSDNVPAVGISDAYRQHVNGVRVFRSGNYQGDNFKGVQFLGAHFDDCDFAGSDLSESLMFDVDARGSKFQDATFQNAYLEGVDLSGANLIDVDMSGATLCNVNFAGAFVNDEFGSGADLIGCVLPDGQLQSVGREQIQKLLTNGYGLNDHLGIISNKSDDHLCPSVDLLESRLVTDDAVYVLDTTGEYVEHAIRLGGRVLKLGTDFWVNPFVRHFHDESDDYYDFQDSYVFRLLMASSSREFSDEQSRQIQYVVREYLDACQSVCEPTMRGFQSFISGKDYSDHPVHLVMSDIESSGLIELFSKSPTLYADPGELICIDLSHLSDNLKGLALSACSLHAWPSHENQVVRTTILINGSSLFSRDPNTHALSMDIAKRARPWSVRLMPIFQGPPNLKLSSEDPDYGMPSEHPYTLFNLCANAIVLRQEVENPFVNKLLEIFARRSHQPDTLIHSDGVLHNRFGSFLLDTSELRDE